MLSYKRRRGRAPEVGLDPPFGSPWDAVQMAANGWLAERRQEGAGAIARGASASATSRSGSGRSR